MTKNLKVLLILLLFCLIFIFGMKFLFSLMAPFLLGIIFSLLSEPLISFAERSFSLRRSVAISLIFLVIVASGVLIAIFIITTFYHETRRLLPQMPLLFDRITEINTLLNANLKRLFPYYSLQWRDLINPETVNRVLRFFINGTSYLLAVLPQILFTIILGGISAFFFSRDRVRFNAVVLSYLPEKFKNPYQTLKNQLITSLASFVRAECFLSLLTGSLSVIFFSVMRLEGALTYGLLAGMLDFIPVLGSGLVFLPLALVYLLFHRYNLVVGILIVYFGILLIRQLVEFKLVGESMEVHQLLAIGLFYINLNLFGFVGVLVGPIMIIFLRSLHRLLLVIIEPSDRKITAS